MKKKTPKLRSLYMHTLDGRPAAYSGKQVCFMWQGAPLATSLRQIRAEWEASEAWRKDMGYGPTAHPHGYRRVVVPAEGAES